jgi:hypothetical protein
VGARIQRPERETSSLFDSAQLLGPLHAILGSWMLEQER